MKQSEKVIRVSTEVYDRLKEKKQKQTFNAIISTCLDASEALATGDVVFRVADKLFVDVAEARGQAIVESVRAGRPAEWPDIYVSIGKADPDAAE